MPTYLKPAVKGQKLVYRVKPQLVRIDTTPGEWEIRPLYLIEVRYVGTRQWWPLRIEDRVYLYGDKQEALRRCRWFNDPKGTESEWDAELSSEAQSEPVAVAR